MFVGLVCVGGSGGHRSHPQWVRQNIGKTETTRPLRLHPPTGEFHEGLQLGNLTCSVVCFLCLQPFGRLQKLETWFTLQKNELTGFAIRVFQFPLGGAARKLAANFGHYLFLSGEHLSLLKHVELP